ncbi:MAG: hypothetical protein KGI29_10060, partial [Pseudomonadota bacterium]|nr:hypothetical protein [Pseudomonadota bacterium]
SGANKPFYVLNRQASTLTVSATQKQQYLIREFIRRIEANASSQVLIEAKIVEVTLDDEFQSGIDWTKLGSGKINFVSQFSPATIGTSNVATFTLNPGADLNTAVKLAQLFGATRTLSSPRLHAINNQEAVMTFAENQIYFSLNVTQSQGPAAAGGATGINTVTVTSTAHTVPIGIIMSVQPSIDTDTNEITLSVRPTLSRVTGNVTDPAVAFTIAQAIAADPTFNPAGISATVPIIEVRELDSILKLKSGQVMVIGGLMQDVGNNSENGLPGVSEIPWIGNIFKGVDKLSNVSELVIFIRATIVGSNGDAVPADRDVYQKFTRDPRPLTF